DRNPGSSCSVPALCARHADEFHTMCVGIKIRWEHSQEVILGTFQRRAIEFRSGQVRAVKLCCTSQTVHSKIGAPEIAIAQISSLQVGAAQTRLPQVALLQPRTK